MVPNLPIDVLNQANAVPYELLLKYYKPNTWYIAHDVLGDTQREE